MKRSSNTPLAVIAALHREIGAANPFMPGVRGRDKIAEATSAVLAYAGLLSLPMRLPGQKQPKPKKLDELCRITDRDLEDIAQQWECMENVRAVLLQKKAVSENEPYQRRVNASDIAALCTAIITAIESGTVREDEVPSLQQLSSFAIKFLEKRGRRRIATPREPRTRVGVLSRKQSRVVGKPPKKHRKKNEKL